MRMSVIGIKSLTFCGLLGLAAVLPFSLCQAKEPLINIITYHNEAYTVWEKLRLEKGIKGAVLIHIDSHDDLATENVRQRPKSEGQLKPEQYWEGSYIHPAVRHGLVSEIWQITPKNFPIETDWGVSRKLLYAVDYKADDKNTYFYFTDRKPNPIPEIATKVAMVPVTLFTCRIGELVDFSDEQRPIFLDFDSDYFANCGDELSEKQDKSMKHPIQKMKEKNMPLAAMQQAVAADIAKVVDILAENNVAPTVVTIAISPDYTIDEFMEFIPRTIAAQVTKKLRFK